MSRFNYSPDADLKVHERGAIRLLCMPFQSHESGLPEWLKNSADAYSRADATEAQRVILVITDYGRSGARPSISCLDFGGMTSENIDKSFRIWADPDAARRGGGSDSIQGGHGNGGKCYMAQMFEDHALLHTVKRGIGNHYGVRGGSFRFGYIPNRKRGCDFPVSDLAADLDQRLSELGCSLQTLPKAAQDALELADGYTLITGVGPKGFGNKIPNRQLLTTLQQHPQMIMTLELCKIYLVGNGRLYNRGQPLSPPRITAIEGAEEGRKVAVPEVLIDPLTNERVSTTDGGKLAPGSLRLLTSKTSMRWKKVRHNVVYIARSGYIGYVPVGELDVHSPYRNHIYGSCRLPALEASKQNERARLATSPLTRALEHFISVQIEQYATDFEQSDLRHYDQIEKSALMKMNEALDLWKNRCLNVIRQARWRERRNSRQGSRLPLGEGQRLEAEFRNRRAGVGVTLQPSLRCFDADGWQIRRPRFRWLSSNPDVVRADEESNVLLTVGVGSATLYAKSLDGRLCSNRVRLKVVELEDVRVTPQAIELSPGARYQLDALCLTAAGEQTRHIYLRWAESDSAIARVSESGIVYALSPGTTEILVGDADHLAREPSLVTVLSPESKRNEELPGQGYPVVLISGDVDPDPQSRELINFAPDDPPVCQRVEDVERNLWWINSASPLAQLYLDPTKGYGYHSREWRIYHLERYIEIIVQILLTQELDQQKLPIDDWIFRWGGQVAEIQSIAASDLNGFIATGELPDD